MKRAIVYHTTMDGTSLWQRTARTGDDQSYVSSMLQHDYVYERMLTGSVHPEGIFDPRGKHNRLMGDEIVALSGYEGFDYTNPYLFKANAIAAQVYSPRKPPYQLANNTAEQVAANIVASGSVWKKWGI